ncbi:MAG: hypothetical protein DRN21_03155 [Thermoplasmata archaeon]|nr:MAG: hypothetical protein DRN21_03155 [Thermoplasmata archaeon]
MQSSLKYRLFWTWDWRMAWDRENVYDTGGLGGGQGIPPKGKENFLHDYQKAIDFMAEHGFNGIIVWGFLRDSHGGVEAARQLCDYGREKDVRVIPGVGINCYGGFYCEGDHEFNLNRWLAKHPELRAIDATGRPMQTAACPSKQETQDWNRRGMEWLLGTFQIGGLDLESGDVGLCHCEECRKRGSRDGAFSVEDMAMVLPPMMEIVHAHDPQLWTVCSSYDAYKEYVAKPPFMDTIPDYALITWPVASKNFGLAIVDRPPGAHNIGFIYYGHKANNTQHTLHLRDIQYLCKKAAEKEWEGMCIYGEQAAYFVNNRINYLALAEFSQHPEMSLEEFSRKHLVPLFGGDHSPEQALEEILSREAKAEA